MGMGAGRQERACVEEKERFPKWQKYQLDDMTTATSTFHWLCNHFPPHTKTDERETPVYW